jgi:glutamate dehydrogenase
VILAHAAARTVFGAAALDAAIAALDHRVGAQTQTVLRLEVRTLVERATRWLVGRRRPLDVSAVVAELADGVARVRAALPDLVSGRELDALAERAAGYRRAGVPADLAASVAALPPAYAALSIVQNAEREGRDVLEVAAVHLALGQRLGLDRLLLRIIELPRADRWQTLARAALRDDLHTVHAALTAEVLQGVATGRPDSGGDLAEVRSWAEAAVTGWESSVPSADEAAAMLASICRGETDLARMSVGLRAVRSLLPLLG